MVGVRVGVGMQLRKEPTDRYVAGRLSFLLFVLGGGLFF